MEFINEYLVQVVGEKRLIFWKHDGLNGEKLKRIGKCPTLYINLRTLFIQDYTYI